MPHGISGIKQHGIAAELQFSVKKPSSSSIKAASLIVPIPAHVHVLYPLSSFKSMGSNFDGYMLCPCLLKGQAPPTVAASAATTVVTAAVKLKLVLEYLSNAFGPTGM